MRSLRRRCRKSLWDLISTAPTDDGAAPESFGFDALVSAVARKTGRSIRILPLAGADPAGPCGLWVATTKTDTIFVDPFAAPVLHRHTVLHELGHIALDHTGPPRLDGLVNAFDALDPS
jgi:hypothetical protein